MEQIAHVVQLGVLKPLCILLDVKDIKIIRVLLDALSNILMVCRFLEGYSFPIFKEKCVIRVNKINVLVAYFQTWEKC